MEAYGEACGEDPNGVTGDWNSPHFQIIPYIQDPPKPYNPLHTCPATASHMRILLRRDSRIPPFLIRTIVAVLVTRMVVALYAQQLSRVGFTLSLAYRSCNAIRRHSEDEAKLKYSYRIFQ